ncbi:MAG: sulfotransferase family protein [Candidatus Thorarchaeota archaeon]
MTIVVLGMHRSGTSLVSGLLHNMGVNMGEKLLKSNINNPKGFFEDVDFYNLNRKLLNEAGGSWNNPPKIKTLNKVLNNNRRKIKELIERKDRNNLWGWKDPRTVLTIEGYINFLNECKFIIVCRNILSVAHSLDKKKKKRVNFVDAIQLASIYERRLAEFIKKHNDYEMLFLSFEEIMKNKKENVKRLASFVDVDLSKEVYSFIDNKLDRSSNINS